MVELVCPRCKAGLASLDVPCRQCGWQETAFHRTGDEALSVPAAASPADSAGLGEPPWLHDRRWVLLLLFAGLGPFGLPWLWRSRAFSGWQKLLLTVAVLALTVLVVVLGWWVVGQLRELYRLMRSP